MDNNVDTIVVQEGLHRLAQALSLLVVNLIRIVLHNTRHVSNKCFGLYTMQHARARMANLQRNLSLYLRAKVIMYVGLRCEAAY